MNILTNAPGKLILSGEYGILCDVPAIAFAVDQYASCCIIPSNHEKIYVYLKNYNIYEILDFNSNCEVLTAPLQLIYNLVYLVSQKYQVKLTGVYIFINSNIPVSSGMGSSAAVIVSLILALLKYFKVEATQDEIFKLARIGENFVHGNSSGLDICTSMHGGCILYAQSRLIQKLFFPQMKIWSVWTGHPLSSTFDCINSIKPRLYNFKKQFLEVSDGMQIAIEKGDTNQIGFYIKQNHALLTRLGVVPEKVSRFIDKVGIAKVSGAGSIIGDNAGMLIAVCDENLIARVTEEFGYSYKQMIINPKGASVNVI